MRKNHSKIVCIKLVHLPYLYIMGSVHSVCTYIMGFVHTECTDRIMYLPIANIGLKMVRYNRNM